MVSPSENCGKNGGYRSFRFVVCLHRTMVRIRQDGPGWAIRRPVGKNLECGNLFPLSYLPRSGFLSRSLVVRCARLGPGAVCVQRHPSGAVDQSASLPRDTLCRARRGTELSMSGRAPRDASNRNYTYIRIRVKGGGTIILWFCRRPKDKWRKWTTVTNERSGRGERRPQSHQSTVAGSF